MPDSIPFFAAFTLYFMGTVFYLIYLLTSKKALHIFGRLLGLFGAAANILALAMRVAAAGHLPSTMYEFGQFTVCFIIVIGLSLERRLRIPLLGVLGALTLGLSFLLSGFFLLFYQHAKPLMPVLKSSWLAVHVTAAIIAYGALTLSFCTILLYFGHLCFSNSADKQTILHAIAALTNRIIMYAMPFLTLLIVSGAIWAEYAWGAYWRWDPKETWSLITWIVYSIYLHSRVAKRWTTTSTMSLAALGFIIALFTLIGVNMWLPGMHSYAQ